MELTDRIIKDPAILCGKPAIKGTRISVQLILEMFAGNMTTAEILENYPDLEKEDIEAALLYAAKRMGCTKADLRAAKQIAQQAAAQQ
jgi:uncharacterized protein (DUF433 family)